MLKGRTYNALLDRTLGTYRVLTRAKSRTPWLNKESNENSFNEEREN